MAASATIKDPYFHPQHLLASYHYSDASTHTCAACERVVTGTGYGCVKCGFHIHKACFAMPVSVSFAQHSREHELTLTRLKASRLCDVCRETSHAGSYMYVCAPCNYDLHPRCVPTKTPAPVDGGAQGRQVVVVVQPKNNRGGGAGKAALTGLHVVSKLAHAAESVCTVVDIVTTLASCTIM
ncbi:unnamed protein product [Urochloa humidicola]